MHQSFMQSVLAAPRCSHAAAQEAQEILSALQDDINPQRVIGQTLDSLPGISRQAVLQWSDKVLAS